jgi:hypothetical protein
MSKYNPLKIQMAMAATGQLDGNNASTVTKPSAINPSDKRALGMKWAPHPNGMP